jgi:hypothetical protein
MDNRKNNKGTIGNKGGRKPKAAEQQLIEKLTPLEPLALAALKTALTNEKAQSWAVPLYFGYMYGKPTQKIQAEIGTTKTDISNIFPEV